MVEHLSEHGRSSLAQLRRATGLPNATLLRILSTLTRHRWVQRLLSEGRFELTFSLASMISAKSHGHPLVELAAPVLVGLQAKTLWPSDVAACIGPGQIKIPASTRPMGPLNPNRMIYGLQPSMVFSGLGRTYLAFCSEAERDLHISAKLKGGDRAEQRHISSGELERVLAETRARGFAVRDANYWMEGFSEGPKLAAIALPIIVGGAICGAVNMVWIDGVSDLQEITERHIGLMKKAVAEIAAEISRDRNLSNYLPFENWYKSET